MNPFITPTTIGISGASAVFLSSPEMVESFGPTELRHTVSLLPGGIVTHTIEEAPFNEMILERDAAIYLDELGVEIKGVDRFQSSYIPEATSYRLNIDGTKAASLEPVHSRALRGLPIVRLVQSTHSLPSVPKSKPNDGMALTLLGDAFIETALILYYLSKEMEDIEKDLTWLHKVQISRNNTTYSDCVISLMHFIVANDNAAKAIPAALSVDELRNIARYLFPMIDNTWSALSSDEKMTQYESADLPAEIRPYVWTEQIIPREFMVSVINGYLESIGFPHAFLPMGFGVSHFR